MPLQHWWREVVAEQQYENAETLSCQEFRKRPGIQRHNSARGRAAETSAVQSGRPRPLQRSPGNLVFLKEQPQNDCIPSGLPPVWRWERCLDCTADLHKRQNQRMEKITEYAVIRQMSDSRMITTLHHSDSLIYFTQDNLGELQVKSSLWPSEPQQQRCVADSQQQAQEISLKSDPVQVQSTRIMPFAGLPPFP